MAGELTQANIERHNNSIKENRQFGCAPCGKIAWGKVDPTKAVWKCKGCGNKYDPFTKDEEMGWGAFVCDCGHQWHNGKSKWALAQPCYRCYASNFPKNIGPAPRHITRKTSNTHKCDGCGTGACTRSRIPSHPHDSTGSTISSVSSRPIAALASSMRALSVH